MNQTVNTELNQPQRDDSNTDSYQRSSPLVIVGYLIRGFVVASTGKLFGLLLEGSGGAVLALYALGTLNMFGFHWSFRLLVLCPNRSAGYIRIQILDITVSFRRQENLGVS